MIFYVKIYYMTKIPFSKTIKDFAKKLDKPLYAVGGYVRNFLLGQIISEDIDLAGSFTEEELVALLETERFNVLARYKHTGTVVFSDGKNKYEYTAFRNESYNRGGQHTPDEVTFTDDIEDDARRRDFKCNAVYYDIKQDKIVDVLGGVYDIENKILNTVRDADVVFASDGLRLMRLVRFAEELNFKPTKYIVERARDFRENIKDISKERIYDELKKILVSDTKYPFSNPSGHYDGLKLLDEIGILDIILPEITKGKGMAQREDYHKYDVFEHTLKVVYYSKPEVRLGALFHDIGKPKAMEEFGKYHGHADIGECLTREILNRLKVDKKTINDTAFLVKYHMKDMDCNERESKIKRFMVANHAYVNRLLLLKQADYKGSKEQINENPTVVKWKEILAKMKKEGTPFTVRGLKICATDLMNIGFIGKAIGDELNKLFDLCVDDASKNEHGALLKIAIVDYEKLNSKE